MNNEHPASGGKPAMVDLTHEMPRWLEDAWMTRYLDRELGIEETSQFEAYCFGREHLLEKMDADADLRDLLSLHPELLAPNALALTPRRVRGRRYRPRLMAVAASLVCGVAGALGGLQAAGGEEITANPTRIVFDTMRGSDDGLTVDHADSRSSTVLLDIAVPLDVTNASLMVEGESNRPLVVSADGFVSALLPRALLKSDKAMGIEFRQGEEIVRRRLTLPPQWESP